MSKDRTVATDALEVLGLPDLGGREVGRDAIHLAVEPAVAGERLTPGGSINLVAGRWYHSMITDRMAIVDPFLTVFVEKGGRFLAVIPPRQITSLRHVWSHPDFPDEAASGGTSDEPESSVAMFREAERMREEGEQTIASLSQRGGQVAAMARLTQFARSIRVSYGELCDMIQQGSGDTNTGDDAKPYDGMHSDYELATGETLPESGRIEYFSCSC